MHRRAPTSCNLLLAVPIVDRKPLVAGSYVPRAELLLVLIHLLIQSYHATWLQLRTRVVPRQDCAQVVGLLLPGGVLVLKMIR